MATYPNSKSVNRFTPISIWHGLAALFTALLGYSYLFEGSVIDKGYPNKPIKVIVPFDPGGGTDTFVRIIQKAVKDHELMPQPLVVVNKAGGSGTVGSNTVKNARSDGYTLLCLHEALLTANITGQSPFGPEAFEPVAATGEYTLTMLVPNDSPYRSLNEIMAEAKRKPGEIILGVNINTPTYFTSLMLENTVPGARFRFVSAGGGSSRLASLIGGHMEAAFFSVSEYIRFRENGLRALALFSDERHPDLPDLPTAAELGFPVESSNLQYWWFPKNTDPGHIRYISEMLKKAMQTDFVKKRMNELKIIPHTLVGEELHERIQRQMERFSEVKTEPRIDLPNVTGWTLTALILSGLGVIRKFLKNSPAQHESAALRKDLAWLTVGLLIIYVGVMAYGLVPFVWATTLFVLASGLMLTGIKSGKWVYVVEISLLLSFGADFIFTRVFLVSLP